MDQLFIWYCTIGRRGNGIPQNSDIWIRENFFQGKEIEGLSYNWLDYDFLEHGYPPNDTKLKLPDELYFIIQKQKKILFDFLPYRKNLFIISESFKLFVEKYSKENPLELSKLKIVHKSGKEIEYQKNYYLLRIRTFNDNLFEFTDQGKKPAAGLRGTYMYPNLNLKNEVLHKIFFLNSFCYRESMIFTSAVKQEIKDNFFNPEIYKIEDFYLAFNNNNSNRITSLPETV